MRGGGRRMKGNARKSAMELFPEHSSRRQGRMSRERNSLYDGGSNLADNIQGHANESASFEDILPVLTASRKNNSNGWLVQSNGKSLKEELL
jgi:hypothetical protein